VMQQKQTGIRKDLVTPYVLPALPYGYGDLAPVIDEETMRLHHDKHHQAYTDGINTALSKYPEWQGRDIDDVLRRLSEAPMDIRETVKNQGGGFANHSLFWRVLTAHGADGPPAELISRISRDFGSFDRFKQSFEQTGRNLFGSGWVFLAANPEKGFNLQIIPTSNQDSVVSRGYVALLACDVWEHAYYLKYNNRRADWLKAWWDIVNWRYVEERLQGAQAPNSAKMK
jgi:Fe-Mn family superoxide dismutase